jgi:CRP-like cAMP-binding protein
MDLTDEIALLGSAPLFSLLDPEPLRLLAFAAEIRTLNAGEVLFREGDRSDGGYVVTDGAIVLDRSDGSPVFVAERGALIGRTTLLVRTARPATATARERATVMRISPTLMRRVLEEFPSAADALYRSFSEEVATLSDGLERIREKLMAI